MSRIPCSCSACKNAHPGGKFLHPSTVWRHRKKEQNLDINSSDIFSYNEQEEDAPVIDDNLERYIIIT